MQVGELTEKVRSKNAGPFWITIDVFCGDEARYRKLNVALCKQTVADLYKVDTDQLLRFEVPSLHVLKFSFPRPVVQGSADDRDMHGAQAAVLLAELDLTATTL